MCFRLHQILVKILVWPIRVHRRSRCIWFSSGTILLSAQTGIFYAHKSIVIAQIQCSTHSTWLDFVFAAQTGGCWYVDQSNAQCLHIIDKRPSIQYARGYPLNIVTIIWNSRPSVKPESSWQVINYVTRRDHIVHFRFDAIMDSSYLGLLALWTTNPKYFWLHRFLVRYSDLTLGAIVWLLTPRHLSRSPKPRGINTHHIEMTATSVCSLPVLRPSNWPKFARFKRTLSNNLNITVYSE
jgi:hypothetical protein